MDDRNKDLSNQIFSHLDVVGDVIELLSNVQDLFSGFADIGDLVDDLVDGIVTAIRGIPFVGGGIADVIDALRGVSTKAVAAETKAVAAQGTAVSVSNQVNYVTEIINVRSGRPFWESGPDPTGDPTFPFNDLKSSIRGSTLSAFSCSNSAHTHAAGTVSIISSDDFDKVVVTTTNSPWGMVRFGGTSKKKVVTWLGLKTGSVTSFYLDLYKMAADGTFNFVQSSADQIGTLGNTLSAVQTTFPADTTVDLGDVYALQFRVVGTGSVVIPGTQLIGFNYLPNFVPSMWSAARNGSSEPVPASIGPNTMAGMYNSLIPWFSLGMDLGAKPIPRYFTDNFDSGFKPGCSFFMPFAAAGNRPQIESNAFSYNRSTGNDGFGGLAEPQPLISDNWFCEFRLPGQNNNAHGMYVGNTDGKGAVITIDQNVGFRVHTTTNNDWQPSNVVPRRTDATVKGAGLWRLEFRISTRKVTVYKDNVLAHEFTDDGGLIPNGPGNRFFGPVASRFNFATSFNVDDLTFGDLPT